MTEPYPIHVVDDDAGLRNSLRFMLGTCGRIVRSFESGEAFLSHLDTLEPGPVLLDIKMNGMNGFQVMRELARRGLSLPIVILTGHGDIPMAVRAMKAGAVDFLAKPFARSDLLAVIELADERLHHADAQQKQHEDARERLAVLSQREFQVLNELARGMPNKAIAGDLGISPRTVEVHRANLMRKLDAKDFPNALRIAFAAGMPLDLDALDSDEDQPRLPLEQGWD